MRPQVLQKYYGLSQSSSSSPTTSNKNGNIDSALSVIKSIPSIDITPLPTTEAKSQNSDDSDIIVLD